MLHAQQPVRTADLVKLERAPATAMGTLRKGSTRLRLRVVAVGYVRFLLAVEGHRVFGLSRTRQ